MPRNSTPNRLAVIGATLSLSLIISLVLWGSIQVKANTAQTQIDPHSPITIIDHTLLSDSGPSDNPDPRPTRYPNISEDGTKVVFDHQFDGDPSREVWLYDIQTMSYTLITTRSHDAPLFLHSPAINSDGTKVVFRSPYDYLNQTLLEVAEIWLYDTNTMTYTRVTSLTENGYTRTFNPDINGDGSRIVFGSTADILNGGPSGVGQIWLYDFETLTFTQITHTPDSGGWSLDPSISTDGSRITFQSGTDLLGEGDSDSNIWLYDTHMMTFTRVSTSSGHYGQISSDGSRIVFQSDFQYIETANN